MSVIGKAPLETSILGVCFHIMCRLTVQYTRALLSRWPDPLKLNSDNGDVERKVVSFEEKRKVLFQLPSEAAYQYSYWRFNDVSY